jgi:hypothetical protein
VNDKNAAPHPASRPPRSHRPGAHAALVLALLVAVAGCATAANSPRVTASAALTSPATASPSASPTAPASPTTVPTLIAPTLLPTPEPTPTPRPAAKEWRLDVYTAKGVRYQNPDLTACTAASALIMLNLAAYWTDYTPAAGAPTPRRPQGWTPTVTLAAQNSMLAYQRKNGTMLLTWDGADAHGWRTALNYFGFGSTGANVYHDVALDSFDKAAMATVRAVAIYRKPVGILASAGNHAQVVTGYRVFGDDPRTGSTNFTITGVYVTDPLASHGYRDAYIPLATWKSGVKKIRFTTYQMTNSPYVDKIDGQQGNAEWDGKWTIVAPVA